MRRSPTKSMLLVSALAALAPVVAWSSCVFELGDVVTPGAGGGGGASGAGGSDSGAARVRIEVDTSALTAPLSEFPLLLELTPERVSYAAAGADGAELRFYAEDGSTLLAHEIERWMDGGTSHVWVNLPSVSPGATHTLWMHAGEAGAPSAPDPTSVWSAYAGVYHFANLDAGARDATASGRDGSGMMMGPADVIDARFGDGYQFNGVAGSSPHISLGDLDAFRVQPGTVMTAEIWYQRAGSNDGYLYSMEGCCLGWTMEIFGSPVQFRTSVGVTNCCNGAPTYAYAQFNLADDSNWHQVVSVMDRQAQAVTTYFDGVEAVVEPIAASSEGGQNGLIIGADFSGMSGFAGVMDEARLTPRALSAEFVALQYATMTGERVTFGAPEPLP